MLGDPAAGDPPKQLKGFEKLWLKPGESKTVSHSTVTPCPCGTKPRTDGCSFLVLTRSTWGALQHPVTRLVAQEAPTLVERGRVQIKPRTACQR